MQLSASLVEQVLEEVVDYASAEFRVTRICFTCGPRSGSQPDDTEICTCSRTIRMNCDLERSWLAGRITHTKESIANARLGLQPVRVDSIVAELLPQLAEHDAQVMSVLHVTGAPDLTQ